MKTLLLSTLLLFFSISLTFGQTKEGSSPSNSRIQKKSSPDVSKSKSTSVKSTHVTPVDGYMGYKEQILLRLIVKEIPQNFPAPKTGQTRDEYKETMLEWFKNNLTMVEEKYHSNLK